MSRIASRVEEQGKSVNGGFLHLFEEKWFFYNALTGRRIMREHRGSNDGDVATTKVSDRKEVAGEASPVKLLRFPSLPTPRVGYREIAGAEEDEVSGGRKLSYSFSSVDAQHSVLCSSSKRQQRAEIWHRRCANPHLIMYWEASYRKAFQNKKWRSLGDLETMELQGFKDLGFVFDDIKGACSKFVRVVPAIGEREKKEGEAKVYLSEAWFSRRSAPPVVVRLVCCGSGDEMKEQLRSWAKAVACKVRQKC